jgi:pseudouridine kinase
MEMPISPNPEGPVLVIGAASIDIVGRLRGELHKETSSQAYIRTAPGGVARNIAENLARLGQPAVLLTAVGSDDNGDYLIEQTARAGVDIGSVVRAKNCPTGAYLGVLNNRGSIAYALDDMRAVASVTPDYLEENAEHFKEASMLFLDANLTKDTLRKAFSLAHKYRLPVGADPTTTALAHRLKPYLNRLVMIVPNEAEAGLLSDMPVEPGKRRSSLAAAKQLVSLGVQIAIVTLAQFGVVYATSETSGQISAIRTEIVDATGAGDALTAAVIFAILNDIPLDEAIQLGVSAASLTLRHPGATNPELSLEKLYDQLVM